MDEPADAETIKSDLKKCPAWVVAKLRDERRSNVEMLAKLSDTEFRLLESERLLSKLKEDLQSTKDKLIQAENQNNRLTEDLRKRGELVDMLERKVALKDGIIAKKDDTLSKVKEFVKEVQVLKENINQQMNERLGEKERQLRLKKEQNEMLREEVIRLTDELRNSLRKTSSNATSEAVKESPAKGKTSQIDLSTAEFAQLSRKSWRLNRDVKFEDYARAKGGNEAVQGCIEAATLDDNNTLELKGFQLSEVPQQVFELRFLSKLDLSNNKLNTIPKGLSQLRLLVILMLNNNFITEVPSTIAKSLVQLRILSLSHNKLSSLPEEMSCSPLLEVLDLSFNNFEAFPTSILDIASLEAIDLSHNKISSIPGEISGLSGLEELYLAGNAFSKLPSSIGSLSSLMVLDVSGNKLENLPEELHQLANTLNELKINDNPLPANLTSLAAKGVVHLLAFLRGKSSPDDGASLKSTDAQADVQTDVSTLMQPSSPTTPEEDKKLARQTRRNTIMVNARRTVSLFKKQTSVRLLFVSDGFMLEETDSTLKAVYGNDNLQLQNFNTFGDYREFFVGQPHANFIGVEDGTPLIVSIMKKATEIDKQGLVYRALIRTKDGDERHFIPARAVRKEGGGRSTYVSQRKLLKALQEMGLISGKMRELDSIHSQKEFQLLEDKLVAKAYKFGVLLCKEGQIDEDEMFSNESGSQDYEDFLKFMGEKIKLEGWQYYTGGLDVKRNSTGTHSIFTTANNYPIMLHVSTLLPYSAADKQQLERKRHLGNDVVVIVFAEGKAPFSPSAIHSEFNHVFVVIRVEKKENDRAWYRVDICSKNGCLDSLPALPEPPVFRGDVAFKVFLYTKLINLERAAYFAPGFSKAILRTRLKLLENMEQVTFPDKRIKNKEVSMMLGKFKNVEKMSKQLDNALEAKVKSQSMIVIPT